MVAIVAAFDRMASLPLWPGFEPGRVPLAIFDGRDTFLIRHPTPPRAAVRVSTVPIIDRQSGRDPSLTANSRAVLSGEQTATLIVDPARRRTADEDGAILIHEAFHVYQAERHPTWEANEAELFVYPFGDAAVLRERYLEERALARALAAPINEARCWANEVLAARARRAAILADGALAYERSIELKEGLATHVQNRASRRPAAVRRFEPEHVRDRAYAVGAGLAALLDRLTPGWSVLLERGDATALDPLLARAVTAASARCAWPPGEQDEADRRAREGAATIARSREEARRAFDQLAGWRIVVTSGAEPLWPQGFDPLNVRQLGTGAILHTRFLDLKNGSAAVQVLGHTTLSEAAGTHPLFQGVRQLTIAGIATEPDAQERGDRVELRAEGVTLDARGALERDLARRTLRVRLR